MTLQRAQQLYQHGDHAGARREANRLLKQGQNMAAALRLLGYIEGQGQNFEAAAGFLSASLKYDAGSVESWYYLGVARQKMAQHADAVEAFQKTLQLAPALFEASHDLGLSLMALGRNRDALTHLEQAARLNPRSFEAHLNHGVVLGKLGQYEAELASYDKALAIDGKHRTVLENYGVALIEARQFSRAAAFYQGLLARHPDFEFARGGLLFAKANAGDWDGFDTELQQLRRDIAAGKDCIGPFELLALPSTAHEQLQVARRYTALHFPPHAAPLCAAHRLGNERLHIAYLSADFGTHPVAFLLAETIELHDRDAFEISAISIGRNDHGAMRARLEKAFDRFVDADAMSDRATAQLISDLNVDIVIDLMGYTRNARPDVLAWRPAPVQISYLGFSGTTGAPFVDYLIADHFVVPEAHRPFYSEKIVCLPGTFLPNDATREIAAGPMTRSDAGLPADAFVFCNFNASYKITPEFFGLWMQLLSRVAHSVLWLKGASPAHEARLRAEAAQRGIAPERLVFAARLEQLGAHLNRLRLADLALDNLPYNAHATASDALWVGLPLLTCAGDTFAGRVAGSLLSAAGLPELITQTREEYLELAVALAQDSARLARIRRQLETTARTGALFDSQARTRQLEDAYSAAWARYRDGQDPDHIVVAARAPQRGL